MKSMFIKSSAKIKPDPMYYRKKLEYFRRKTHELIESLGLNRDIQPPDSAEQRAGLAKIDQMQAKGDHYARMMVAAYRMVDGPNPNEYKV